MRGDFLYINKDTIEVNRTLMGGDAIPYLPVTFGLVGELKSNVNSFEPRATKSVKTYSPERLGDVIAETTTDQSSEAVHFKTKQSVFTYNKAFKGGRYNSSVFAAGNSMVSPEVLAGMWLKQLSMNIDNEAFNGNTLNQGIVNNERIKTLTPATLTDVNGAINAFRGAKNAIKNAIGGVNEQSITLTYSQAIGDFLARPVANGNRTIGELVREAVGFARLFELSKTVYDDDNAIFGLHTPSLVLHHGFLPQLTGMGYNGEDEYHWAKYGYDTVAIQSYDEYGITKTAVAIS